MLVYFIKVKYYELTELGTSLTLTEGAYNVTNTNNSNVITVNIKNSIVHYVNNLYLK